MLTPTTPLNIHIHQEKQLRTFTPVLADSSSKKLEVTQMSLNKCNEKLIVVFSYDGIPYQSENDWYPMTELQDP